MANFLKWIVVAALMSSQLEAKDFGIYGATSPIEEEDLLLFIQNKIQSFSPEERQALILTLQNHFTSLLEKPMEIEGICKATAYFVFYFDPTICAEKDILNHEDQIIVRKGTLFNPLSQFRLEKNLLFFDATDLEQLSWAQSQAAGAKWILVRGNAIKLGEKLQRPVYFDQGAVLIKKLGITQVPALVSSEGAVLKIEYIPVQEDACKRR